MGKANFSDEFASRTFGSSETRWRRSKHVRNGMLPPVECVRQHRMSF